MVQNTTSVLREGSMANDIIVGTLSDEFVPECVIGGNTVSGCREFCYIIEQSGEPFVQTVAFEVN